MGSEDRYGKVPLISKIAYGFGDVGCNFSWMFVSNFLMIFYTDVFGISMTAVSALMLFSRFWDAINDPIVGGLTDKTKTRWGRYRPWLLIAAPVTAILLMMTFWAHPDWSDTSKIIYMVITYCLLVLGYTCVNIPYGTLCGAMTQDIDERAKINTSRSVAAMIAIGIINIITVPLIGKLGSSSQKTGYLLVAIIYGCIFAACHIFCFAKTKEQVTTPEKDLHPGSAESSHAEPAISSGTGGTGTVWFHSLRKKRGCSVLLYLCGGKRVLLYNLLHVYHHSVHYRSCLLSAGLPETEQQRADSVSVCAPYRNFHACHVFL